MKSSRIGMRARGSASFRFHAIALAASSLFVLPVELQAATINVAGACVLRDAINAANTNLAQGGCTAGSGADIIVLPVSATLTEATALPTITSNITIQGRGGIVQRSTTAPNFRVFTVTFPGNLTVEDLTIRNGLLGPGEGPGGGISTTGALTVRRSTITGNTADAGGGGIYVGGVGGASLRLERSTVSNNSADGAGGGIDMDGFSIATIVRSTISGNTTQADGGGIDMDGGYGQTLTLLNSTVSGNSADDQGGGIIANDTFVMRRSTVTGNTAENQGGGLYLNAGNRQIVDSTISGNRSLTDTGGGIHLEAGQLTLSRSTVSGNNAANRGGGLYQYSGSTSVIQNSTFSENTGEGLGGGILNRGQMTLANSTVSRNFVQGGEGGSGGGISNRNSATLTLSNSLVSGNLASVGAEEINNGGVMINQGRNVLGESSAFCVYSLVGIFGGPGDFLACGGEGGPFTPVLLSNILNTNLTDNGGPTRTHALPVGSPAIDIAAAALCTGTTDQRGVNRPKDGNASGTAECDAGAVERGQNAVSVTIDKTSNGPVVVGDNLNFTLNISNAGPENASDVEVFDTLPAGLTFLSATPSSSGECFLDLGAINCELEDLLPNNTFSVQIATQTTAVGAVTNLASFLTDDLVDDYTSSDFEDAVTTQVLGPTVTLSATPASILEAGGTSTLRANLSRVVSFPVTVTLAYTGTAASPADYTRPTSITIPAGATSATAVVTAVQDTLDEDNETIIASIGSAPNAIIGTPSATTVTITGDDAPPTVRFSIATQTVAESIGNVTVTAQLSIASGRAVTVPINFAGTAINPADYGRSATSITIPAGQTSGSLTLSVVDDSLDEVDETVVMTFGTLVNATPGTTTVQTVTITDNDTAPTVSLAASLLSIAEAAGSSTLTATLSAASSQAVTVNLAYTGTAGAGDSTRPASITIPAGSLSGTATVTATQDAIDEANETVVVDISTVTNATESGTQQRTITITDDDNAPTVTLAASPLSIAEAAGVSTLTVTLSAVSSLPVTVNLAYSGTAGAGDSTRPASITIPAGSLSGTATVTAIQDAIDEANETVVVDISTVTNATESGTQQTTITILDDDDEAPDTTLDPIVFTPVINAALNSVQTSNAVALTGINTGGGSISVGGDASAQYCLNSNPCTSSAGTFATGDTVRLQVTASANPATTVTATLMASGSSASFNVTTRDPTTTPTPFSFTPVTGAAPGAIVQSNTIVVSGLEAPAAISITGDASARFCINGNACTAMVGAMVSNGDVVKVQLTASSTASATVQSVLTIGSLSAGFSVTTGADLGVVTPSFTVSTSGAATSNTPVPQGAAGTYSFNARFCVNSGQLSQLFSQTTQLSNNNSLINRTGDGPDSSQPGGVGSTLSFVRTGDYADGTLSPGECITQPYLIGLATKSPFTFRIDLRGARN